MEIGGKNVVWSRVQKITFCINANLILTKEITVSLITTKASERLYILYTLKKANADIGTLLKAYKVCVRPVLEYCAQVWHFCLPKYLSQDIERIQRRAMKIVFSKLEFSEAIRKAPLESLEERKIRINVLLQSNQMRGRKIILQINIIDDLRTKRFLFC